MLVWVWPPEAEATWMFFGSGCSSLFSECLACSCVSCSFWFYFNNWIWFLRSSISLSLSVDVYFVVEGKLVGDFPRWCCVWAGCSNSSFFKRVGGFSWMFVLLVFLKCLTFGLMMLVPTSLPFLTFPNLIEFFFCLFFALPFFFHFSGLIELN